MHTTPKKNTGPYQMKRIAIIVPDINFTGGAEHVAIELAKLLEKKNTVMIVSLFSTKTIQSIQKKTNKVAITHMGFKKNSNIPSRLIEFLRNIPKLKLLYSQFDFIIGNNTFRYFLLPYFNGNSKLIEIQHLRFEEEYSSKNKLQLKIRNYLYKRLHKLVVLTERDRKIFCDYGLNNVVTIPNFIPETKPLIREKINRNDILIVGRLTKQKNHISLLRSWHLLKKMEGNQKLRLHIAGDGPELQKLKCICKTYNIEDSVIFHGNIDDLSQLYSSSALLISTSLYEGFPLTFLEALNYSLPILTYDFNSGANELVINNYNGIISPLGDEETLAKNIAKLANDENLLDCMSMNAEKHKLFYTAKNIEPLWVKYILDEE
ncbi:glycosyltransferase [Providencia rettgeri]